MLKTRRRILAAGLAVVAAFHICVAGALAFWRTAGVSKNILTTGVLDGTLVEEYEEPQGGVYPGDTIDRVVNVRNDGNIDMVVRLKVDKFWNDNNGRLDDDLIQINVTSSRWLDGGDGYYYYKGILSPGETTKEPLMRTFSLDPSASNEYMDKKASVVVSMECLQATSEAVSGKWGKSWQQLGIQAPQEGNTQTARVEFTKDKAFEFQNGADLFGAFKELIPGETRTQTIEVKNSYKEKIELFLKAEPPGTGTSDVLTRFLRDYAVITVTDAKGTVLYDGPADGSEMNKEISLGSYASGESGTLKAKLTIKAEAGNEFQGLSAENLQWIFTAQGENEEKTSGTSDDKKGTSSTNGGKGTSSVPKTGDENGIYIWCIGIGAVTAAMAAAIVLYDKKEEKARKEKVSKKQDS